MPRASSHTIINVATVSSGLLMFRQRGGTLQVLLVHPGGPYWANKDEGAWTLPKGEVHTGEELLNAAQREFIEETGWTPQPPYIPLGYVRQKSGKVVHAWAFESDIDPATLKSNMYEIDWPPRSGRRTAFPEVDRAEFFSLDETRRRINPAQVALLRGLEQALRRAGPAASAPDR